MVKVIRVQSFGGPDVLGIDELAAAEPKPHEVRVRTAAIGLNRIEAVFRSGGFGAAPLPARIGYEAAGAVEVTGSDVTSLLPGDRVATVPGLDMNEYGVYAESFVYPADMLIKIPDSQSLNAAAATWMAFLTAYVLAEDHPINPGEHVIVTAASSSVGLAALQVVRAEGGIPIAVTRTRAKADALQHHGAEHVVVTDEEDLAQTVLALTGGKGAALAFDAVAGHMIGQLAQALAQCGTIIVYGGLAADEVSVLGHILMLKGLSIRGFSANQVTLDPKRLKRALAYITEGVESGRFLTTIDRRFRFGEIAEAHRYLESNAQLGKIIVTAP